MIWQSYINEFTSELFETQCISRSSPDDIRFTAELFDTRSLISQTKQILRYFVNYSFILHKVKRCKVWPYFSTPVVVLKRNNISHLNYRVVQKNCTKFNVSSFCSRSPTMLFVPKRSVKITLHESMQTFCRCIKHSLINGQQWIHVISDFTVHVNMTLLTAEDRLLIKILQTGKKECWQNDCCVSNEIVEMAYAMRSRTKNWFYWQTIKGWVVAIDVVRSEPIKNSSRLMTWTAYKTENKVILSQGEHNFR